MSFTDRIFDTSSQALMLRAQRSSLLAANLANADTPGYKARDIDFSAAMRGAEVALSGAVRRTDARHLDSASATGAKVMYRQPLQASVNGNTVEVHREQLAFMDNAIRYQASLGFLDSRIKSVRSALRGE
ncbi:flagellar basal body rod protein FlgB [Haliea atlantica]|jgi:flagellar basal-body rod protein FlgB|nr:flagellar basal body rod protein FlgB [Haliea sp.]|tara:strand:+ start:308298 stop:308687 length:390 start_codon:yes stop_codon:yes gene_type:complete